MNNILSAAVVFAIFAWCMSLALAQSPEIVEEGNLLESPKHDWGIPLDAEMRSQNVTVAVVNQTTWHLLTKSHGGTISLIKNLTQDECMYARARALGEPATQAEKDAMAASAEKWFKEHPDSNSRVTSFRMVEDGDIVMAECFE